MTWLYLSILAAFLWAAVNVWDKIIVSRLVSNPVLAAIATGFVSLIFGTILLMIEQVMMTSVHLFLALGLGIVYLLATVWYFYALQREETSRIVPLFALGNIWIPLGAGLFLGEILTLSVYVGIAGIAIGSFLIMWRPGGETRFSYRSMVLMVVSTVAYAVYAVGVKQLLQFYSFWTVAGYAMAGYGLGSLVLTLRYFKDAQGITKKVWATMLGNETLNLAALLIFILAASKGFISLVNAAAASQYIFIFLFGLALSHWFPRVLKEDLKPSFIFLKFFATLLIVSGVVWIALRS